MNLSQQANIAEVSTNYRLVFGPFEEGDTVHGMSSHWITNGNAAVQLTVAVSEDKPDESTPFESLRQVQATIPVQGKVPVETPLNIQIDNCRYVVVQYNSETALDGVIALRTDIKQVC